jgi:hypothetical protein
MDPSNQYPELASMWHLESLTLAIGRVGAVYLQHGATRPHMADRGRVRAVLNLAHPTSGSHL